MPNRILKESICTSETIDELSAEEERFFYRLLVNCDDYGRTDARPKILKARLFPLRVDSISDRLIGEWLEALARAGLVSVYVVGSRPYLHVTTWQEHQGKARATTSKWPRPQEGETLAPADICTHLLADDCKRTHMSPYPDPYPESNPDPTLATSPEVAAVEPEEPPAAAGQAEPASEKPKRTRKTEPKHDGAAHRAMFGAVVEAYGFSADQMSTTERGMVNRVSSDLIDSGLTPGHVGPLKAAVRQAFPNLGTISPTMLPKYVYLLRQAPTNGHKANRPVDEPKSNGTNYVALLQARQKDTRNAGENQATGESIDNRGPPASWGENPGTTRPDNPSLS